MSAEPACEWLIASAAELQGPLPDAGAGFLSGDSINARTRVFDLACLFMNQAVDRKASYRMQRNSCA